MKTNNEQNKADYEASLPATRGTNQVNSDDYEASLPYLKLFRTKKLRPADFKKAIRFKFFRLCTMYYIKNAKGEQVRLTPNEAQVEYYLDSHKMDIILKARQLGFTTWKMIYDLDDCLFKKNYTAGCIAHNDKVAKDIFRSKIRFAYEHIKPSYIRMLAKMGYKFPVPLNDRNGAYIFSNGSSIAVSTGYRGDTLQSLHISELGKIALKYPDKALEIKTGAFPAASGENSTITIESTAEGRSGDFFDYCEAAQKLKRSGRKPHNKEFNFHFFPWSIDPKYTVDPEGVKIPDLLIKYFDELEHKHDLKLTDGQKAWYSLEWMIQGDAMKREFPSTPAEAFEKALKGAYYKDQFIKIYRDGRICESMGNDTDVYTAWDIGVGDNCAIWFYRKAGNEIHLIDYYENSGEGIQHYMRVLHERGYNYASHYGPHDMGVREFGNDGKTRKEIAAEGVEINGERWSINFELVPKIGVDDGIDHARQLLDRCVFDKDKCDRGITCLESYRKQWNDKLGVYRDKPLHDWASDGADAFRYLAVMEQGIEEHSIMSMTCG